MNTETISLSDLAEQLEKCSEQATVLYWPTIIGYPTSVDSYRGYYEDLALGHSSKLTTVKELVSNLKGAENQIFEGYKGGNYQMHSKSSVYVDNPGECSGIGITKVVDMGDSVYLIWRPVEDPPQNNPWDD